MTIEELAAQAGKYLVAGPRQGENTGRAIKIQSDDAPEWFNELCRNAHGDMMPDDWRYEFIDDALISIENGDENAPDIDSAYPYTCDRLRWLASRLDRTSYCDDARKEFGIDASATMDQRIALGMASEMDEVFGSVLNSLNEQLETIEEETIEV